MLRASGKNSVHPEHEAVEGRASGKNSVLPEHEAVEGRASGKNSVHPEHEAVEGRASGSTPFILSLSKEGGASTSMYITYDGI